MDDQDVPVSQMFGGDIPVSEAYRSTPKKTIASEAADRAAAALSGTSPFFKAGLTRMKSAVGRILGGAESLTGAAKIARLIGDRTHFAEDLEQQGQQEYQEVPDGWEKTVGGAVGGMLPGLVAYSLGGPLAWPLMGAVEHAKEGVFPTVKGAAMGALTYGLLGPAAKIGESAGVLPKVASAGAQGGVMAGMGALQGETKPEDLLQNFLTGGAFGVYGMAKHAAAEKVELQKDAEALGATPEQLQAAGGAKNWLEQALKMPEGTLPQEEAAKAPAEPVAGQTPETPTPTPPESAPGQKLTGYQIAMRQLAGSMDDYALLKKHLETQFGPGPGEPAEHNEAWKTMLGEEIGGRGLTPMVVPPEMRSEIPVEDAFKPPEVPQLPEMPSQEVPLEAAFNPDAIKTLTPGEPRYEVTPVKLARAPVNYVGGTTATGVEPGAGKTLMPASLMDDPPVRTPKTPGQIVPLKSQAQAVLKIPDIPQTFLNMTGSMGANARKYIQRFGGPLYEQLYRPAADAFGNSRRADAGIQEEVQGWDKRIKDDQTIPDEDKKNYRTNIGLRRVAQQPNGLAILKRMGAKFLPNLHPAVEQINQELTAKYPILYKQINDARGMMGYEPIGHIDDYTPLIHNLLELEKSGVNPWMADAAMLTRRLNAKPFEFATPRTRNELAVELDAVKAFQSYATRAAHYTAYAPFKAAYDALTAPFDVTDKTTGQPEQVGLQQTAPELYRYLHLWAEYTMDRNCSDVLKEMPKPVKQWYLGVFRNIGAAQLGFNIRTAAIHALKFVPTITEIGPKWTAVGYRSLVGDGAYPDRQWVMDNNKTLPGLNAFQATQEAPEPGPGKVMQFRDKFMKASMAPLQYFNNLSAEAALHGAYQKAIAPVSEGGRGLSPRSPEALHYADDVVANTQGTAAPHDLAQIQRYPTLKPILMYQTFMVNQFNYLAHDVLGISAEGAKSVKLGGRTFSLAKPDYGKMIRYGLAAAGVSAAFQGLLHMRSPYPTPEWAIINGLSKGEGLGTILLNTGKELAEPLPVVGGAIRWSTGWKPMEPAGIQEASDLQGAAGKLVGLLSNGFDLSTIRPEDWAALAKILGIPGTGEAEKIWRRRQAGMGWLGSVAGAMGTNLGAPAESAGSGMSPEDQARLRRALGK